MWKMNQYINNSTTVYWTQISVSVLFFYKFELVKDGLEWTYEPINNIKILNITIKRNVKPTLVINLKTGSKWCS